MDSQTQKVKCANCGTQLAPGAVACFKCGQAIEVREPTNYTDGIRPPTQVSQSNSNLLDGKWLLVEKIGAGGMGTVWLAKDTVLDRKVAVKILSPSLSALPEYIERFEREARVMASLDHANLITLFAVGRHQGQPYMVMKFLDGQPLTAALNPRLTPQVALPLFRQMCDGLSAMHARNILHRDIKPANLFVSPTGHLTILDLGIARQVGSTLTKTGIMFGTPAYMSPEQIAGDKTLDPRTDIYSAGAVLFEMLTGHPPYEADEEHSLLLMHIQQPPPDASQKFDDIPRGLAIAIQRALSKRPADRFANITEFYDAAAAALGQGPLKALLPSKKGVSNPTRELVADDAPTGPMGSMDPSLLVTPVAQPSPVRKNSKPDLKAKSGSNPAVRSKSNPDQPAAKPRNPSGNHPAQGPIPPPDAPDAPTPKGHEAPVEMQVTRPRKAMLPPLHLGQRILLGIGLAAFVGLSGYFMLRVIAETPADEQKPVLVPGQVVLKQADDTIKAAPKLEETPAPQLADSIRNIDNDAIALAKLNSVGAQSSVITAAEEAAKKGEAEAKSRGSVPPSTAIRMPGAGELRITTTYIGRPVSATVFIGKRLAGKTPLFVRARKGIYRIKVLYPELDPVKLEYVVTGAKGHDLQMELGPPLQEALPLKQDEKFVKRQAEVAKSQANSRDEVDHDEPAPE